MRTPSYSNTPGYVLICIGLLLSCIAAFVPHYEAGHKLMASVLFSGMLPYLVYGIAVPLLRGPLTTLNGVVIVVVHAWLVFDQRFAENVDYSNGLIYYVPVILAVAVLPLAFIALKKSTSY